MILDMTCGSKSTWFNKHPEDTVFLDKRVEQLTLCDDREIEVKPDVQADFCHLPFADNTFHLVLFDPPHLERLGETSWMYAKYGALLPDWRDVLAQGFSEAFRVLKPSCALIFKWNETQIPVKQIVELSPYPPMFGHRSGKASKTHWLNFVKPGSPNE
jgi:hypothetical protein|nr:SAM-dependent methyltransferase [uncultured Streptococcus sp.]